MTSQAAREMVHARVGGFTTVELMITLAVLAILVALAAPSFRESLLNARMTAQANDLAGDLNIARSEAVKRNLRVFLCTSSNGRTCTGPPWNQGWMIFVDANQDNIWNANELPIKATPALSAGNALTVTGDTAGNGGARFVPYRPSGISTPGVVVTFIMCDLRNTANVGASAAQNKGRTITINQTGRVIVQRRTCAAITG